MKELKYIIITTALVLFASCMGKDYAEPNLDPEASPYGNNEITTDSLLTIKQLKNIALYKQVVANSANKGAVNTYAEIDKGYKIKGVVTGNDIQGNLYQEVSLQDSTGAILVCVAASGIYGYLPVGQEVLIDCKGLIIGGYGAQAELGGLYINSTTGVKSVGRMDRYTWQKHFKLIGSADASKAEVLKTDFDLNSATSESYLEENAGKLMTIKRVVFRDANGKNVYAPNDGSADLVANCVNRQIKQYNSTTTISSNEIVVRTSTYADFANNVLPGDTINITGIFTRYRDTWQILMRTADDISKAQLAYFSEPFDTGMGDFTIENVKALPSGLNHVWAWASSAYGMKASAYVSGTSYETSSRLKSPAINLSSAKAATLHFMQVARYFSNAATELKVQVSTDGTTWKDLTISGYPDGASWDFLATTADLSAYCGKKTVYIGFLYNSTSSTAATWEIKNVTVE
jgi:hypothetical protein